MKLFKTTSCLFLLLQLGYTTPIMAQQPEQDAMKSIAIEATDDDLNWGPCPPFMPEGCNIAVLHGDPSKPNADIFFKVPANSDIPDHWHNSPERMVLISGEMEVTYEGETTKTLTPGTYAYGPAQKPHTARCTDAGPCILFIAFEDPVDAIPTEDKK